MIQGEKVLWLPNKANFGPWGAETTEEGGLREPVASLVLSLKRECLCVELILEFCLDLLTRCPEMVFKGSDLCRVYD